MNYDALYLTSGGTHGYSILGSIYVLEKSNYINLIKRYIGVSVGSLISFLLILKYKSSDIFKILSSENIEDIYFNSEFERANVILNLIKNYGMSNACGIDRILNIFLKERHLNLNLTFKELYEFNNIEFITIASNITRSKLEYFSYKLTPNVNVLIAIKASCAIPMIFNPIKYNNCLLVDGGFYNNIVNNFINNKTLTIRLKTLKTCNSDNIFRYIKLLFSDLSQKIHIDNEFHSIELIFQEPGINFNITNNDKMKMYNYGLVEIQKFIKWKKKLKKIFDIWRDIK